MLQVKGNKTYMKKIILITSILLIAVIAAGAALFSRDAYVVPVLMYHAIDNNDKTTKLSVSPEGFARQMEFLHKHHYNVVGFDKVVSYMQKKEKVPPRTVAITFDDGLYNNYANAYPVLKKYGIPATMFIIIKKIGQPGYMGWKEIKEMADSGVITIGSHTVSHLWLPAMGTKELVYELQASKEVLENNTGKKVDILCYPIGAHNERVERFTKESGYACAVATNPGHSASSDDIFAIKRIKISRTSDNLLAFWVEISGYYTWIKEHRDDD
jgi:peptidoglycan/xylan/chitin deacetylase (PgdA/CDA1 family)